MLTELCSNHISGNSKCVRTYLFPILFLLSRLLEIVVLDLVVECRDGSSPYDTEFMQKRFCNKSQKKHEIGVEY